MSKSKMLKIIVPIIVVIIGLVAAKEKIYKIIVQGDNQGQIFFIKDSKNTTINTTINYNLPSTTTEETITELNKKLNQAEEKVELTKKDIKYLTQALRDLDQRTSGIEKLPDGRTKIGDMISGNPSIVIDTNNMASTKFKEGNYIGALEYSKKAINAYEKTKNIKSKMSSMSTGNLSQENIGIIYRLGAMAAQQVGEKELAYQYAEKATKIDKKAINEALLSTTLYNIGKYPEALKNIEKALQKEPDNSEFIKLKKQISLKA